MAFPSIFIDPKACDLADCSSHLLEHFFGMIRRFCAGNDLMEQFDFSIEKAICLHKWLSDLKIQVLIPGRVHHDKAAIIEEGLLEHNLKNRPFIQYIKYAIDIILKSLGENIPLESIILGKFKDVNLDARGDAVVKLIFQGNNNDMKKGWIIDGARLLEIDI